MRCFKRVFAQDIQRAFSGRFIFATVAVMALLLLENTWELKAAFSHGGYTVYHFLFNTIIFSGLLGTYAAPVACTLPYCSELHQEETDGIQSQYVARTGYKPYLVSKFLAATLSSGVCLSVGYWLFIAVLLPMFPFSGEAVISSGMSVFPYTEMSLAGNEWGHILIILYYGFCNGALYGALSMAASSFFKDKLVVYAMPFLLRFAWVQLYRIISISGEYRLDYWLLMRTSLPNETATMVVTLLRVLLMIIAAATVFLKKWERRVAR